MYYDLTYTHTLSTIINQDIIQVGVHFFIEFLLLLVAIARQNL